MSYFQIDFNKSMIHILIATFKIDSAEILHLVVNILKMMLFKSQCLIIAICSSALSLFQFLFFLCVFFFSPLGSQSFDHAYKDA